MDAGGAKSSACVFLLDSGGRGNIMIDKTEIRTKEHGR